MPNRGFIYLFCPLTKSWSNIESLFNNLRRNDQYTMNILVCEDNIMTLRAIEFSLRKAGYNVFKAENGHQGIEILGEEEIDLVITDINMPYTKGLELIRHVNTQLEVKIPVIVISGITNVETRAHAMELGAEGYLTKPFDPKVMLDLVKSFSEMN